jgi:hypothetical protein
MSFTRQIPPELLGLAPPPQPMAAPNAPAPPPPGMAVPAPMAPPAPTAEPFPQPPPNALAIPGDPLSSDPILASLLGGPPITLDPELMKEDKDRRGYMPLPDWSYIDLVTNQDQEHHRELVTRFGRDLSLYRQKQPPNIPPLFDPHKEVAFKAATVSNIVNKLTNMASAGDWQYEVPHKDEATLESSQTVENWLFYLRQCDEDQYTESGGGASLQWDEFFYCLQFGRIVARILPDASDTHNPYIYSLLDPATVYPTWGDSKEGLIRVTRKYEAKVVDVLKTYSAWNSEKGTDIEAAILEAVGGDTEDIGEAYLRTGTLIEYWDPWNRAVKFMGVEVMRESHRLGYVPFVYCMARGEPRSVTTPEGVMLSIDENNNAIMPMSSREDLAEKGVSVFHHIVNTHRMTEIIYTLLLSETLKAQNPAMIQYVSPQMANQMPPPVKTGPAATNQRILNHQQVEIVPTSPRPTDTSPVLNKVQADTTEGTINPAMYGSMDGSNIAGFAVESLISAARDTILPYTQTFERFHGQCARMKMRQYVSHVGNIIQMSAPMEGRYGSQPHKDVTPQMIVDTGYKVTAKMIGVSDSMLPAMINMGAAAVEAGIKSRRWAMEKTGDKDPRKMFRDIIIERAIEHPEIMENIIIPQEFLKNGQNDLAYMWGFLVVMPKFIQTMQGMMGGMGGAPPGMPPGMPGMGGPPNPLAAMLGGGGGPPQLNGQSNPMAGRAMGPPTGPLPGQGRQ